MGYAGFGGPHNTTMESISFYVVAHEPDGVLFYTESKHPDTVRSCIVLALITYACFECSRLITFLLPYSMVT